MPVRKRMARSTRVPGSAVATALRVRQTGWEGHPGSQASRHSGKVSRKKREAASSKRRPLPPASLQALIPAGARGLTQPPAGPRGGRQRQHHPRSQ
ncbi:hypothetical protein NDU88_006423 [Pleurodeles waltl]|uniref:Uncharacterized protein n=1 Tax=Pleurodeles waltl TaxID=8319 RepID=A0AAV7VP34_PLEWA|nr:hypothetical protein NDU88_006423 [Pleurodeles waltl]